MIGNCTLPLPGRLFILKENIRRKKTSFHFATSTHNSISLLKVDSRMVRFRRQSSTPTGAGASEALTGMRSISLSDQLSDSDEDNSHGLLRRSRRRSKTKTTKPTNENSDIKEGKKKKKEKPIYEDEMDPYDSDPGESYRSHCLKINGIKTSCLRIPRRLKNTATEKDETTAASSPPSPVSSEVDDILQHTPETLPSNTTRVRYSLRTSIGDGSQSQPNGPSLMSRRELRPNNVQVNVSHWSDCGARPYMEDRYELRGHDDVCVDVLHFILTTLLPLLCPQLLCGRSGHCASGSQSCCGAQ